MGREGRRCGWAGTPSLSVADSPELRSRKSATGNVRERPRYGERTVARQAQIRCRFEPSRKTLGNPSLPSFPQRAMKYPCFPHPFLKRKRPVFWSFPKQAASVCMRGFGGNHSPQKNIHFPPLPPPAPSPPQRPVSALACRSLAGPSGVSSRCPSPAPTSRYCAASQMCEKRFFSGDSS